MKINGSKRYILKIYLFLIIFVMLFSYFANVMKVFAEGFDIASGSYQNINWVIKGNGEFIISGTGNYRENSYWYPGMNNYPQWYTYRETIKKVKIDITSGINETADMFLDCYNLTEVTFGSQFDTSEVINMKDMFRGCSSLISIDLSGLDTSKVIDMSGLFKDCYSLQNINFLNFNTSNVEQMGGMFSGCSSLQNIDLTGFNATKVKYTYEMFKNCKEVKILNLSTFDNAQVWNMEGMFEGCENIKNLNLSNIDASKINGISRMFKNCFSLKEVKMMDKIDASDINYVNEMFKGCRELEEIDLSKMYLGSAIQVYDFFDENYKLNKIITPNYIKSSIKLPVIKGKKWVEEGNESIQFESLPSGKPSITLINNECLFVSTEKYNIGNDKEYSINDKYIYKIIHNTKVSELKENIVSNGKIDIYNNSEIINDEEIIKTGDQISIYNDKENISLILIVSGDINCDGKVSITDLSGVNQHLIETITLNDERKEAADVDNSGNISISDYSKLNQYLVGYIGSL